jgi:hypothetical protein
VTAARERGDKTPESILSEIAAQNFIKLKAAMDPRMTAASAAATGASAAVSQAGTAETRAAAEAAARDAENKRKATEDEARNRREALSEFNKTWENARFDPAIKEQLKAAKKAGPEAVQALKNRLQNEYLATAGVSKPQGAPTGLFSPKVNRTVTQAELEATAKNRGMTVQQVKAQLGIQ